MGRLLVVMVLSASMATPAAALEVPAASARVMCPPVTLVDLAPPDEPEPLEAASDDVPSHQESGTDPAVDPPPAEPTCDTPFSYDMGSPFIQKTRVFSSFGAPRPPDRLHEGIDIPAPKLTPVFAVADGVVVWVSEECCNVAVRHRDGWRSYYVHLNNDTFGTDDGLGTGVAPGIAEGVTVERGRLLGWVGDSGNAEETEPHLHFELRMPDGRAIDAAESLREAEPITPPPLPIQPEPDEEGTVVAIERYPDTFHGAFADDDGHPHESMLNVLASWGLVRSCDDSGVLICPDETPSGAELVGMLMAAGFDPPPRPGVYERRPAKDPTSSLDDGLAVRGCGTRRFCPDQAVSTVEADGMLLRSTPPAWLPPRIDTLECDSLDRRATDRAGLLLRMAELLGAVLEPPCDLID